MMNYYNNWGMGIFGALFMILFWALIIYLAYLLIKGISNKEENALEILNKRFAKGEITKKEFEFIKKKIKS